jgi:hypothetical protein
MQRELNELVEKGLTPYEMNAALAAMDAGKPETEHPKAIAARALSMKNKEALLARRAEMRKRTDYLVTAHHLKFVDITPHPGRISSGITIAYSGDSVLKVSTAIRNPADQYNKLQGRYEAARARNDGHWIYLKKPKGFRTTEFLRIVFEY